LSKVDASKEMQAICSLITWFDGFVHLSCVDPLKMERVLKFCGEDIITIWDRLEKDFYSIGRLPGSSAKVVRLSKIVNITRFFFIGFALFAIVLWLLASQFIPKMFSASSSLVILAVIAVVFNADLAVYIFSTRRLSHAVDNYFRSHGEQAKFERKRIRDAAQYLIDKLSSRVRASGEDPEAHKFALMDSNYSNVKVVKEKDLFIATVRTTE
jgi:hypothetical protein